MVFAAGLGGRLLRDQTRRRHYESRQGRQDYSPSNRDVSSSLFREAVVHFDQPDYVPIFGFRGAGFANGAFRTVHGRLVETGMPSWVGGQYEGGRSAPYTEGWQRYGGTTMPLYLNFFPAAPPQGFEGEVHTEGEYEIVESETGAVSRQVPDNEGSYGMPEFLEYDVRDRKSWEFCRQNDLFELRERFPRFVFMGWLEKEVTAYSPW